MIIVLSINHSLALLLAKEPSNRFSFQSSLNSIASSSDTESMKRSVQKIGSCDTYECLQGFKQVVPKVAQIIVVNRYCKYFTVAFISRESLIDLLIEFFSCFVHKSSRTFYTLIHCFTFSVLFRVSSIENHNLSITFILIIHFSHFVSGCFIYTCMSICNV